MDYYFKYLEGSMDYMSFIKRVREQAGLASDNEAIKITASADTLAHRGTVYIMKPEEVPGASPMAAVFRYY